MKEDYIELEKEIPLSGGSWGLPVLSLNAQTLLVLVTVFLLAVRVVQWFRSPGNLPPGPLGFPILGVLPRMGPKPYLTVQKWWREYGDLVCVRMGSRLVLIVNGVEMMRECFVKQGDTFSARPWNYFKKLTKNRGIVFTEGDVWREHRRFSLSCLRDFGMGKVSLERKIQEEAGYFLEEVAMAEGKPLDMNSLTPKVVSNIICSIIYGSRFDYHDEAFKVNINALDQSVRKQSLLGLIQFLPFLEILPKILPNDKLMARNFKLREEYADYQLMRHRESFDPDNPRDFIDAYLTRMYQMVGKGESTHFSDDQLKRTIQDLFIAGTETVNTTLKWAFLFMAVNPDIQKKVQAEVDVVLGTRMVTMKDRSSMPYTEATYMECQRLGNIALFSVPRCTTKDTKLDSYDIPAGTWVFVNRWGAHMSDRYWARPKAFDPNRFLDSNGNICKPESFVPFGMGPRACLGEALAKMELFIFFTTFLQNFHISLPDDVPVPSLEPKAGINMSPHQYKICCTHR